MFLNIVETVDELVHRDTDRYHVTAHAPLRNAKNDLFRAIDRRVNFLRSIVGDAGNFARRRNQPTLRRQTLDQLSVMLDVNRRRHRVNDRRNI